VVRVSCVLGLVVAGWVEVEVSEDFAGRGGDDLDMPVVDQHDDGCLGVGSSDTDVVEFALVAEGEFSVSVDFVVTDAQVGGRGGWCCFGEQPVFGGWGCADGSVGSVMVVGGGELVEQGLECAAGGCWRSGAEPLFEGLLEAFDAPMFVKRRGGGCSKLVVGWLWGGSCRSPGRCSA